MQKDRQQCLYSQSSETKVFYGQKKNPAPVTQTKVVLEQWVMLIKQRKA